MNVMGVGGVRSGLDEPIRMEIAVDEDAVRLSLEAVSRRAPPQRPSNQACSKKR